MSAATTDSARLRVVRILWGALFSSTCMFIVVLLIQQRADALPTEPVTPLMLPVLGAVALGIAVLSVVFPRQMFHASLKLAKLEVITQVDEGEGPALFRDAAPTIRVFAKPDEARTMVFPKYQTAFILGMALSEAVALFGLVLGMQGVPLLHVLPFWVVCWALMIMRFPTPKRIFGPLEKVHDAVLR